LATHGEDVFALLRDQAVEADAKKTFIETSDGGR